MISETAAVALATFFATVGPIDVAAMFAALTLNATPRERLIVAIRGTAIATGILLFFAIFGESVLDGLGISLAALRTAGGVLLLLIGIDLVFGRSSGATSATEAEAEEAAAKPDISVFPLATPLIAGPGAMGASILLMADTEGDLLLQGVVIACLLAILALTLLALIAASQLQRVLGVTGTQVIRRVFGILLTALAVQFFFDGISQSNLLASAARVFVPA
ncbi:MAG TPA: MarC family protein [Gammaproteobacteria bacterium]|jgi:multiple antibiotic resistance protein